MVDPLGYPYFATGLDIIRLSNTSTMTGYDFDQGLINQRKASDLTPEDSQKLNRVSNEAAKTRYVASDLRKDLLHGYQAMTNHWVSIMVIVAVHTLVHLATVKHLAFTLPI